MNISVNYPFSSFCCPSFFPCFSLLPLTYSLFFLLLPSLLLSFSPPPPLSFFLLLTFFYFSCLTFAGIAAILPSLFYFCRCHGIVRAVSQFLLTRVQSLQQVIWQHNWIFAVCEHQTIQKAMTNYWTYNCLEFYKPPTKAGTDCNIL